MNEKSDNVRDTGQHPLPGGVLMCRPLYFDVVDRKNPFMDPSRTVDRRLALAQWGGVRSAFAGSGMRVVLVDPIQGCEDMVFAANPALTGRDRRGRRRAVASRMRHPSRADEVTPHVERLRQLGYAVDELPPGIAFEGGGDAVWHLGEPRLYAASGPRSDAAAAAHLARIFDVEVVPLRLATERYYHLDTCLAVIDRDAAIVYPPALDPASVDELRRRFPRLIEIGEREADAMAANAARAGGDTVVVERHAAATAAALRQLGFTVRDVDTSELRKAGGSVYCMKQYLF